MIAQTLTLKQLESIKDQLVKIHIQLYDLKHTEPPFDYFDAFKTILLFSSPFITGYIFYLLTRNKEYRVKRGEISGKIEQALFEYEINLTHFIYYKILRDAAKQVVQEWSNGEFLSGLPDGSYSGAGYREERDASQNKVLTYQAKTIEARATLVNVLSQYKFYLLKKSKIRTYKTLCQDLEDIKEPEYEFSQFKTLITVLEKRKSVLETYEDDTKAAIKPAIDNIKSFLEKNID